VAHRTDRPLARLIARNTIDRTQKAGAVSDFEQSGNRSDAPVT
jgi:hypothetical protein